MMLIKFLFLKPWFSNILIYSKAEKSVPIHVDQNINQLISAYNTPKSENNKLIPRVTKEHIIEYIKVNDKYYTIIHGSTDNIYKKIHNNDIIIIRGLLNNLKKEVINGSYLELLYEKTNNTHKLLGCNLIYRGKKLFFILHNNKLIDYKSIGTNSVQFNLYNNKPIEGNIKISSAYGPRKLFHRGRLRSTQFHHGVDIPGKYGTPILSILDGYVTVAKEQKYGYGNHVKIKNMDGYEVVYGHLSKINVQKGEKVKVGQNIGSMGASGFAFGTHLHLGIYYKNKSLDPLSKFSINTSGNNEYIHNLYYKLLKIHYTIINHYY